MNSLMLQESHRLNAIGRHVQMHRRISVVKRFLRQPDIARAVFNQKYLDGHSISSEDLHDLHQFLNSKNNSGWFLARNACSREWLWLRRSLVHGSHPYQFDNRAPCACRGKVASVSQNSLMFFTRLSKASNN